MPLFYALNILITRLSRKYENKTLKINKKRSVKTVSYKKYCGDLPGFRNLNYC